MPDIDHLTAAEVIDHLGLEYLEGEGIWISLIWRSETGSAIYALLTREDFSALHRLREDEFWTHVAGASIDMLQLHPDGRSEQLRIGHATDDVLHALVPSGSWQGSSTSGDWALVTCALAPPFSGFELADAGTDLSAWPDSAPRIRELIRG